MNISAPFIRRPVATSLLTIALLEEFIPLLRPGGGFDGNLGDPAGEQPCFGVGIG